MFMPVGEGSIFGGFIPPTPAIKTIFVGSDPNQNITATNYTGSIRLIEGSGVTILADYLANTLTFSSLAGSISTYESLTNTTNVGCAENQIAKVNSTGFWDCADDETGTSGEANTASNIGAGLGVFNQKTGVDLEFNSLIGGNGIDVSDTTDDITIDIIDCQLDEIIKVDGTGAWICATDEIGTTGGLTDLTDVTLTAPAYNHIIQFGQTEWINKLFTINSQSASNDFFITGINNQTGVITRNQFSVNTITCGGTDKISAINNVTGHVTCTTDSTGAGASDIISEGNSNVEVIDAGTGQVDIDIDGTNEFQFFTNLFDVLGATIDNVAIFISNAADPADAGTIRLGNTETIAWESSPASTDLTITADSSENFVLDTAWNNVNLGSNPVINHVMDCNGSGNSCTNIDVADLSTGTDGQLITWDASGNPATVATGNSGQVLTSNGAGTAPTFQAVTVSGLPVTLGSPVTCSSVSPNYCTVFTVPLTSSSGNHITAYLDADSNTSGVAVQVRVRTPDTGATGWCRHETPLTATTQEYDNFVVGTAPTDTGTTTWLPAVNVQQTLIVNCAIETDSTASQTAIIEIQMETTGTGTIMQGSYYIKTP